MKQGWAARMKLFMQPTVGADERWHGRPLNSLTAFIDCAVSASLHGTHKCYKRTAYSIAVRSR